MDKIEFLSHTELFEGSSPEQIEAMIGCMGSYERWYCGGEYIHRMGDFLTTVGLILEGSVRMENVDVWGNVSVLGAIGAGEMFGEAYAAVSDVPLMVNVVAVEDTVVLFLNLRKVLTTCSHACDNHSRTSNNMTAAIARRNLELSRRIFHGAPKTIRGKVLTYLSDESERLGSREFDIPFDRQQLADYLGVDRSALSAELSRMQKAGLIETKRSHFVLK